MKDCKAIPVEVHLTQHKLVCSDFIVRGMTRSRRKKRTEDNAMETNGGRNQERF